MSDDDDEEDEDALEGEDDTDAEREMLETTPSNSRSSLPRRSKSVKKSYHEDDDSDDESSDNGGEDDMVDGEYDIDAEREALEATPSKSRPRSKSVLKPQQQDEKNGDTSASKAHEDEKVHQDDDDNDDDEVANLPKVTLSTPVAHEDEQVNFFATKTSEGAEKPVQTQQVPDDATITSGGVDLSWMFAPLMSYPRDTWSGLILALLWIWQFIVVPFELMTIAFLIWEVQGEDRSVNA